MARRLVKSVALGRCAVKIYRDSDTREFVVRTILPGGRVSGGKEDGGYFTEDKSDARGTAAAQIRWLRKHHPGCRA